MNGNNIEHILCSQINMEKEVYPIYIFYFSKLIISEEYIPQVDEKVITQKKNKENFLKSSMICVKKNESREVTNKVIFYSTY